MKLATYKHKGETAPTIGAVIQLGGTRRLIDLAAAQVKLSMAGPPFPADMRLLLDLGEPGLDGARSVIAKTAAALADATVLAEWRAARFLVAEDEVRLLALVRRPARKSTIGLRRSQSFHLWWSGRMRQFLIRLTRGSSTTRLSSVL